MTFVIKHHDKYQTNDSIHSKDTKQTKKKKSFTINKTIFRPKGCLHFLNKDIKNLPPYIV